MSEVSARIYSKQIENIVYSVLEFIHAYDTRLLSKLTVQDVVYFT